MTPPPTLEQWLAGAIQGLRKPVAAEVQAELEAHYGDALDTYLAEGRTPESAQAAALADLGDARTVQRMLRRVHLSRRERLIGWITWLVPLLWQHRALIATALFGLAALSVVVGDHRHWISYSGHLDPLTPPAFAVVLASLLFERRLAMWSYPAAGYLLSGIWPWLFFEGLGRLSGPFWDIITPMVLPGLTFIVWGIAGLRVLRRTPGLRVAPISWPIVVLTLATTFATTTVQLADGAVAFRPSALSVPELRANIPWVLYSVAMLLVPVAIGLLAARRDDVAATLIPLGCHYALFVGIADPTYHLTFYDYWQPARALHIIETLVTYLPALMTFLIAPLWMLRARSRRGRVAAALLPAVATLALTHILSAIGLPHTWEAYTAATWVSSALETITFVLPVVLAVVLYSRFGPGADAPARLDNTDSGLVEGELRRLVA